ncbi:Choline-sulfatase [Planctomycetes bacterium Poly30]|uniref:Choline-sulfatase n=1 Tax=Saltatorellus ferox TaxID=2528018 RepID=A0A518EZY6_9BACT|nr:Choline-sulfatase [Planctomycetes bacterium Poly30]
MRPFPPIFGLAAPFVPVMGVLGACFVSCGPSASSDDLPPPVILISLDTVRADCIGVYGAPEGSTPALDAFSLGADRYETCTSAAPWTMPSHASLFTGLYPFEHGAHSFLPPDDATGDNVFALNDRFKTLAEALQGNGYRTGGVVSNAIYLRPELGLDQGFADWDVERAPAPEINRRALAWLDKDRSSGRPTFLFVNYMDAHRPYRTGDPEKLVNQHLDRLLFEVMNQGELDPELAALVESLHQKAVTRLDAELERFFDGLKERGLFDDSLIVVTSDHGESFGAHAIVEHSKDVYEDTVQVPLIVKLPGQRSGRVIRDRASSVHVAGLIAGALGGTDAETLSDLFPRVPGPTAENVLVENYYSRLKDLQRFGDRFKRRRWALYDGSIKLIAGSDNGVELYDLSTDPGELTNLAEERSSVTERLLGELQARLGGPTAYEGDPVFPGNLTDRQRADFDQLGYGGSGGDRGNDAEPKENAPR